MKVVWSPRAQYIDIQGSFIEGESIDCLVNLLVRRVTCEIYFHHGPFPPGEREQLQCRGRV
jgi:hypothetical protein